MNATYESRAEAAPEGAVQRKVLVWDAPVRVFHWLMVLTFAGAWLTAESERWRLLHVTLGYTMAGLVVFRILWGLFGTRPARFTSFIRGPSAALRYLGNALRGRAEHHTGHNPAGALAIVALLALALAVTASGWATYNELGGHWLEELHEGAASFMLALVLFHLAGVVVGSLLHRENLVRGMITGRKAGSPNEAASGPRRFVAVALLVAVLTFWAVQWQAAPAGGGTTSPTAAEQHEREHDDD